MKCPDNNTDQVKKRLIDLCHRDEPLVAVLKGAWGAGKTHFWTEIVKTSLTDKKYAYISLFGFQTIQEIRNDIILQISKKDKAISSIQERFKDFKSSFGFKDEELNFGLSGSVLSALFTMLGSKDFEDVIVCFDDFERISDKLNPKDIMGFISHLKEQKNCKVIMIFHDEKLDEKQKIFVDYKEKVVDYEFLYCPSIRESYSLVANTLEHFVEYPLDYFLQHNIQNIRIMKRAINALNDFAFIRELNLDKRIEEELSQIILSIAIIHAQKHVSDFSDLYDYWIKTRAKRKDLAPNEDYDAIIGFVEDWPNGFDALAECIAQYFQTSIIDETAIKEIIESKMKNLDLYDLKDALHAVHDDFFFDLSTEKSEFIEKVESLLSANENKVIRALGFENLLFYISLLEQVSEKTYKEYVVNAARHSIDHFFALEGRYSIRGEDTLEHYKRYDESLKIYIEQRENEAIDKRVGDCEALIQLMQEPRKRGGWGDEEALLNSIPKEVFKKYMMGNAHFVQVCFDFVRFVDGFAGSVPFAVARDTIMQAFNEIKAEDINDSRIKMERLLGILKA